MNNEIINGLKERAKEMLNDDYSRKIGDEEIYTIICEWKKTFDLYNKEKEKNRRNKRIALNKLEKLKNGIENDFPIKLGEQQPLWEDSYTKFISKDKIKEKIKELENERMKIYIEEGLWSVPHERKIEVLQELLME